MQRIPIAAVLLMLAVACDGAAPGAVPTGDPTTTPATEASERAVAPPTSEATEPGPEACRRWCYGEPRIAGTYEVERVPEASGIVAGRRNPGVYYLLDDGPGADGLLAIAADGSTVARLRVDGMDGWDTEDLAAGPCGDGECLYIGDIGDNLASRDSVTILRVAEPDLDPPPSEPLAAERIDLRYPDGPVDAEALLVDRDGALLLVTKEAGPDGRSAARLLRAPGFADATMDDLGAVRVPQPARPLAAGFVGHVVTGADSRPGRVLIRTYDAVFEYLAPRRRAPLHRFGAWRVREVPAASAGLFEAVAYTGDGCGFVTVAEGDPSIWLTPCLP